MFVESSRIKEVLEALSKLDKIEEFSEVTGGFDILGVVSCSDMEEFRDVLKNQIHKIPGVRSTVSSIALETHRGSNTVAPMAPSLGDSIQA